MRARFLAAIGCAILLGVPATALAQVDPPHWDNMQPKEYQQTRPVHAHPTDYNYPLQGANGVWHVTVCSGSTGTGSLRIPLPGKGFGNPNPSNDPNGGASPHANWRSSMAGTDGSLDIEGHTAGTDDLTVKYSNPQGGTSTFTIHVVVIDCTNANEGGRGVRAAPGEGGDSGGVNPLVPLIEGGGILLGPGGRHDHRDRSRSPDRGTRTDTDKSTTTDKPTAPTDSDH